MHKGWIHFGFTDTQCAWIDRLLFSCIDSMTVKTVHLTGAAARQGWWCSVSSATKQHQSATVQPALIPATSYTLTQYDKTECKTSIELSQSTKHSMTWATATDPANKATSSPMTSRT
jgi:hypothetical protein